MGPPAVHDFNFFIQWHLTERCNFRCRHCYQSRREKQELLPDEVCRQIDGATEMFRFWEREQGIKISPSIHFTGGEPFLYQGFWDVLKYAKLRGYETAVMTNGSLIRSGDACRIRELNIKDIQISLEGPPAIHDAIRGEGAYAAARQGMRFLAEAGNRVSANVTLSRLNVNTIAETVSRARDMGANAIGFSRMVPCGRGLGMLDQFLAPGEVRDAYEEVLRLNLTGIRVVSCDPLFGMLSGSGSLSDSALTLSGCSAGFSGVTVTSDGSVMSCRRIGIRAGTLGEKTLREIWATSPHLWRLRKRENYRGRCGTCDLWPSCRGCRAIAHAYTKALGRSNLFADDPQCWRTES